MKKADRFLFRLVAQDRYFLYNSEKKIGICNLTVQVAHGIVRRVILLRGDT
jgi:hypothetical protein